MRSEIIKETNTVLEKREVKKGESLFEKNRSTIGSPKHSIEKKN